jgi:hypothetical protein
MDHAMDDASEMRPEVEAYAGFDLTALALHLAAHDAASKRGSGETTA